ncbi:uncharacterized protein LOC132720443, partial [Ruditapes philippinarum]|uniref:uncharacterized protein LOC132720443 n=1 Tax=Ruditapes philippinarum TaxID=129788 RepID=UPI00295BA5EE
MSVFMIVPDDAKILANKLRASLQSNVAHIRTTTLDGFLELGSALNDNTVRVIFLTALLWQDIERQPKKDVGYLFSKPKDTILLISCAEPIKKAAVDMFSKMVNNWESVGLFTASGEDWFNAEARIKYRVAENENREVPSASRYLIKPDTISTLSEPQSEVFIILFDDVTTEHNDVTRLEVKDGGNVHQARKIQPNIWSFNVFEFTPGEHDIRVLADDVDIGPYSLHIQDKEAVRKELLTDLKKKDPKRFIAELLNINEADFDRDLMDTISGSSCVSFVEILLKYGEENECEYPNFAHFCAEHGLEECAKWCAGNLPNFKEACKVRNNVGQTPQQVAVERRETRALIEALGVEEDLEPIQSPFGKGINRDSGWSSQGSVVLQVDTRPCREPPPVPTEHSGTEPTRFQFNRQQRPYNTIEDDDAESTYNRPWEDRTFLPNRSAQALSAGTLSRSIQEDSNGRGRGLARSNTTGGSGTRL